MKTLPGRQDGIAALRQRLFFAGELVKLAERELAGDAINRQAIAMACRNGASLQLHAVLTGMLDDIAVRLRVARATDAFTVESLAAALGGKGMVSPELARLQGMIAGDTWLRECFEDARRCLSSQPEGEREPAGSGEPDAHNHHQDHDGARRLIAVVAASDITPLSSEDIGRLRRWISGWKSLLDEFLVTLDEF